MKSTYNNSKTVLAVICLVMVICSCKKLIEINPPVNTISTGAAFGSDTKLNSVMAGLYSQMINGGMGYSAGATTLLAGLSADEVVNYNGMQNLDYYNLTTNKINANSDQATATIWGSAYKTIYNANGIIENLSSAVSANITDSLKVHSLGEAKFARAFAFFYLTNFYGDVPLVLSTNFNNTSLLPRASQDKVYLQIVQDLKDAQTQLPVNPVAAQDSSERIRVNKAAATALLARVYLYQKDWKDAETLAGTVISDHRYSLPADLKTVFLKNSSEVIWQLKQDIRIFPYSGTNDGANFSTYIQWEDLSPDDQAVYLDPDIFSSTAYFLLPQNYLTGELNLAFETGDKRRTAWVRSTPSPDAAPYNGMIYNYPFKYTNVLGSATSPATQYYVVLRLAEQYLIRGEARAQQGDLTGAAADINTIRRRAGLPDLVVSSQASLLSAIAQERRIEFFAEWGHRWFDLKRTGKATEVLGAIKTKQPWKPYQLLYPIPVSEIIRDPKLTQNPGY